MLTLIGCLETSSLVLEKIFSFASDSKRDYNSAAVFNWPRRYAVVILNCGTKSLAFRKRGGINLV